MLLVAIPTLAWLVWIEARVIRRAALDQFENKALGITPRIEAVGRRVLFQSPHYYVTEYALSNLKQLLR